MPHGGEGDRLAAGPGQVALLVPGLTPISPLTYHNLFGLLASTGLRISEALSLQCDDLTAEGLMVRSGKFGKSRLVPIHVSTRAALERYLEARAAVRNANDDLFVLGHGHAPTKTRAHVVFVRIVRKLGYRNPTGPGPRLHLAAAAGNRRGDGARPDGRHRARVQPG